ncbi:serine protease [uncultured Rhodoblastus sp.]|uniref:trypsin-like serine peptidase n=1 Tax=uncultured Rhodoblastus sp. TaxID=543037 RepID=UPI0025EAC212|nr:serine protease [uncultured Rhodoblastus sp.]
MNDASTIDAGMAAAMRDDARILAEWTRLDLSIFRAIYRMLQRRFAGMPAVEVALLDHPSDPRGEPFASMLALCVAARKSSLLGELCVAVANAEVDDYQRDKSEADAIVERIGGGGTPHTVLNSARGLANPRILGKLSEIFKATARVRRAAGGDLGTAFLVGKDEALTCAHVALEKRETDARVEYGPRLAGDLQLVFPETEGGEQIASVKNLLASSPPYFSNQDHLISTYDAQDEPQKHLDFALLKLDRTIYGAKPVPIDGVQNPSKGPLSFVIGYRGGSDPAMDADSLMQVIPGGSRVIHSMNAVPGMSGSCCSGEGALPIGLHEGSIPWAGAPGGQANRAILLCAIKNVIAAQAALAAAKAAPRLLLQKASLVQRLGRRGQQLCGEALGSAWSRAFEKIVGAPPDAATVPFTRHPILGAKDIARRNLNKWFETATASDGSLAERIMSVEGPPGCGKSFSINLLEAALASPERDLLRLEGMSPDKSLLDMARALAAQLRAEDATRTRDGQIRYDTVEDIVAALARWGQRDRAHDRQAHPLFVAIDAGENADAFVHDDEGWLHLTLALAKAPWSRLLICGLSRDSRVRLEDALEADPDTRGGIIDLTTLGHLTGRDVADFLRTNGRLDGAAFSAEEVAAAEQAFDSPAMLHAAAPNIATAEAALLVIGMLVPDLAEAVG